MEELHMRYNHLSFEQRCYLATYCKSGLKRKEIAWEIGVSRATVSNEIKRNVPWNGVYSASQAQVQYEDRRKTCCKQKKFTPELKLIINEKLTLDWSLEQISGYGKKYGLYDISHESIYRHVLKDKKSGGSLYLYLHRFRKRYRKRLSNSKRFGTIKNRVFIDERPKIIEERTRIGDWEIDTVIGKQHKKSIVTIVDRVSKKTLISCVVRKKAEIVAREAVRLLLPFKSQVFTITADNGSEFAHHEAISRDLQAKFYFAYPYHSWERGLNENTNGLIRQYIPKGTDLSDVTTEKIAWIMDRLNNRPRKSLEYATPNEVFERTMKD